MCHELKFTNLCRELNERVEYVKKNKVTTKSSYLNNSVGVTGFEPATTRPPDAYSNRAELHPELRVQK